MTLSQAAAKRLNQYLESNKISIYKIAKMSGLSESTVHNLFNGSCKSPTLAVIFKIARGLGISPLEFLDCDVFKDEYLELE